MLCLCCAALHGGGHAGGGGPVSAGQGTSPSAGSHYDRVSIHGRLYTSFTILSPPLPAAALCISSFYCCIVQVLHGHTFTTNKKRVPAAWAYFHTPISSFYCCIVQVLLLRAGCMEVDTLVEVALPLAAARSALLCLVPTSIRRYAHAPGHFSPLLLQGDAMCLLLPQLLDLLNTPPLPQTTS